MTETANLDTGQDDDGMEVIHRQAHWTTTAVTTLPPGWVNVFGPEEMGAASLVSTPAPATLTQTRVALVTVYRHAACGSIEVDVETAPATRVVFAEAEYAQLLPALDNPAYIDTVTLEQFAEMEDLTRQHWARHHPDLLDRTNGHHDGSGDGAA